MQPELRTRITFRREIIRSMCSGVIETAGGTFLLLIAVKAFMADPGAKSMIAAGSSVGLFLSPLTVAMVGGLGWPASRGASGMFAVGACAFALASLSTSLVIYVFAAVIGTACASAAVPLMTQVYHDNYPAETRGRLYSRTFMVRIASAIAFGHFGGWYLARYMSHWQVLLMMFSAAFGVGALALHAIPSRPLRSLEGAHPFHALRFVREDRLFRQALIAWMLMGFANLMMLPLRVEYLANEKHGLARSADQIAMLTVVIPNMARLCLSPVWGWLFDRMNFFALRATLNVGFALGILGFFTSDSTPGLVASAIIYGVSNAGGDVAWGLWVTKFAPADRVADYMSVHTFLTGVRGVIAPFAAFQAIRHWSLAALGWISAAFIVAASILLLPEALRSVRGRRAEPPTEEIQD